MARGGYRPGAGRPKSASVKTEVEVKREASKAGLSPLEYMLSVMNDDQAERDRRDKMAIAAAPYVHAKADEAKAGKKEQKQQAAEQVAKGRFAPRSGPRLAVVNGS